MNPTAMEAIVTEPVQLSIPEHAQINIYVTPAAPPGHPPAAAPEDVQTGKPARPLRRVAVGLLLFGLGFGVHGLIGLPASAESDQPSPADYPVMPAPPGSPSSLSGPRQGAALAPGIRVTPPQPPGSPAGGPSPPASIGRPVAPTPYAPAPAARSPFGLN